MAPVMEPLLLKEDCMEFKKDKGLYVMPTIFTVLSIIAIIIVIALFHSAKTSVLIPLIMIPSVILIISLSLLISRVCARDVRFSIDDLHIYVGDLTIDFKAVDYLTTKAGLFVSIYRPNIEIVLKSKERVSISRVKNPLEVIKLINKKYLKLKGPGIR